MCGVLLVATSLTSVQNSAVMVSICEFAVCFSRFLRKNHGSRFGFGFYGSRF